MFRLTKFEQAWLSSSTDTMPVYFVIHILTYRTYCTLPILLGRVKPIIALCMQFIFTVLDSLRFLNVVDPDSVGSEFGSRRAKMTHKNKKKLKNFMFWSAGWMKAFPVAWTFFCRGVGEIELQFLIKKILKFLSAAVNYFKFWSSKPRFRFWIRIGIQLKCWIRIGFTESGSETLAE